VAGLASSDSDVLARGAPATAERGIGASLFYRGTPAITPDVAANKFQALFEYCDNYRKKFVPEMLEAYNQYNGELDQQTKESWQSNIFVPLPSQAIDVAAGRIVSALFSTSDFFEVDPDRKADDQLTEFAKKSTLWQLSKPDENGMDGVSKIKVSVKDALICGQGPMKVHYGVSIEPYTDVEWVPGRGISVRGEILPSVGTWQYLEKHVAVKRLRLEPIIPTDCWYDPTGKNRFSIHRSTRFVSDLWDGTEDKRDPETNHIIRRAVYDKRQVARVRPGMHDTQRQIESARVRRDLATPYGLIDQTVDVYELWGDFIDITTGAVLYRNQVSTYIDRRITIRMPQINPFRHLMSPFVCFTSKLLPHQVYPYGLLYQNRRLEDSINRQANVIADKAMLQVPTLEYDKSACSDPTVFGGDRPVFKPGKFWPRKPGPDKKIFYPVEGFQPVQPMDLAWLDRLTNWYATGSTVSEWATGQQLSNNRKTKAETEVRTQASNQNFNDAAVHIEAFGITPLLRLIYLTMIQYLDGDAYDDADLTRMFGDDEKAMQFIQMLKTMSPPQRWKTLYLDSQFKAVGVTNEITRQKRLGEVNAFVQTLNSDPLLSMFVDKRIELEVFTELYRQPRRMILDNAEALIQQIQMAHLQQIMQPPPPGGGAGGPGGPGTGPQPGGPPTPPPQAPKPPGGRNPHNALAQVNAEAGRAPNRG
jgi:hypothetical protein